MTKSFNQESNRSFDFLATESYSAIDMPRVHFMARESTHLVCCLCMNGLMI